MDSLVCTPCTPEMDEHNASAYQFCTPESREPFTPTVSNTGLGVVYEVSNDIAMLNGLPHTTTDVWGGITQSMNSSAMGCADDHFWTEALQPQIQPTSIPVDGWTPMSLFQQQQISAPSLSPHIGSVQPHCSTISVENMHPLLVSPSLTHSTRSVTPSEINSLDEYKPMLDYAQTPAPTPHPHVWYPEVTESSNIVGSVHPSYPHVTNETLQALLSTVSSPSAPTLDVFGVAEGEVSPDSPRRRASLPEPLAPALPGLEAKKKIMEEKVKLTRQRHPKRVAESEKPVCHQCDRTFSRKHNLHQHIERIHRPQPKHHKCEYCPRAFNRPADLNRHRESIHSSVKPWLCDVCNGRFPRKDTLRRHFKSSCLKNLGRKDERIVRRRKNQDGHGQPRELIKVERYSPQPLHAHEALEGDMFKAIKHEAGDY